MATKKTKDAEAVVEASVVEEPVAEETVTEETVAAETNEVEAVMEQMDVTEEEMNEFFKMFEKMYQKRRFTMMSAEERKKAYHNEHIAGGKGAIKTDNDLIREEAVELQKAAQSVPPEIMTGNIYGYEFSENLGIPMVSVSRKDKPNFEIKIPVSQLFVYDAKDYEGPTGKRRLEHELRSRMGSEIKFVVYQVLEAERVAYGSRLKAMELTAKNYYKPRKGKSAPELTEGCRTSAKVTSVKNNRIKVEVFGAETEIKSEELSWRALESLTSEFKVGQEFEVIIHDIETVEYTVGEQSYNLYTVKASRREALPNPVEKFFHQFRLGQCIGGVVKKHDDNGVFVDLAGKIDCLCPPPAVGQPIRGDKCIIEITKVDEKKFRLFGRFIS